VTEVAALPQRKPIVIWSWYPPDAVSDVWDTIKAGLEEVARYGDHWRPEDVYMALRQGHAALHLVNVAGRYGGFMVTVPSRSWDGPVLHVWAVYAVPGLPRLRRECFGKLRELATEMKARRITFTSPRKGWEKLGRVFGFEPALTIFECEVQP
jgi:hypothetical protein